MSTKISNIGNPLGIPRQVADFTVFPQKFELLTDDDGVLKPVFIQTMENVESRLLERFSKTDCSMFYVVAQPTVTPEGKTLTYGRVSAFGNPEQLASIILDNMVQYRACRIIVCEAFSDYVVNHLTDEDPCVKDLRRCIIHWRKHLVSGADKVVCAEDVIEQFVNRYPERQDCINALRAEAKRVRRSGRADLSFALLDETKRLEAAIAADDDRQQRVEQSLQAMRDSMAEARRCKQMRRDERMEQLRWEHDYEGLQRRQRSLRAHIERAQRELDALCEQERLMQQQQPQFNVHKAAKQKAQAIAARKAERNARKKKAKESADATRSCSPILKRN